ncbi:MAG TPA: hypothetical protein VF677_06230 [Flavobacterium sp.]|jgi:hypothetical protein
MNNIVNKLNEIKKYGYHLDLGIVISQAFENYKKIALTTGALLLVLIVIFTVLVGGVAGIAFGIGSFTEFITDYNILQFSTSIVIIRFLVGVIGAGLIAPITAGIFKMAHHAETNTEFGFSTAFDYYKTAYFKDLFLSAAIVAFCSNGINLLITTIMLYDTDTSLRLLLTGINRLIAILIGLYSILIVPSIIFGNLNAVEAIKASFLLVRKRFWTILLLLIVAVILAMTGIIGFCLGIFFTLPFIYSMEYIIYRNAVNIDSENALDEIGSDWNS